MAKRARKTVTKRARKNVKRTAAWRRAAAAANRREHDILISENERLRADLTEQTDKMDALRRQLMRVEKEHPAFQWTTRHGDKLTPVEMDEQHLRNTISYLQRRIVSSFGSSTYVEPVAELCLAFHHMVKEAKRRGFEV